LRDLRFLVRFLRFFVGLSLLSLLLSLLVSLSVSSRYRRLLLDLLFLSLRLDRWDFLRR
jgi:ABC-type transport system involved in cytochrome c biogenesis permease component